MGQHVMLCSERLSWVLGSCVRYHVHGTLVDTKECSLSLYSYTLIHSSRSIYNWLLACIKADFNGTTCEPDFMKRNNLRNIHGVFAGVTDAKCAPASSNTASLRGKSTHACTHSHMHTIHNGSTHPANHNHAVLAKCSARPVHYKSKWRNICIRDAFFWLSDPYL